MDGYLMWNGSLTAHFLTYQCGDLSAVNGATRCVGRRRPKNDQPLISVVIDVLSKHPKGLTLKQLAARVLATGYKSISDKLENMLYQCLYNNMNTLAHDAKTHTNRVSKVGRRGQKVKGEGVTAGEWTGVIVGSRCVPKNRWFDEISNKRLK